MPYLKQSHTFRSHFTLSLHTICVNRTRCCGFVCMSVHPNIQNGWRCFTKHIWLQWRESICWWAVLSQFNCFRTSLRKQFDLFEKLAMHQMAFQSCLSIADFLLIFCFLFATEWHVIGSWNGRESHSIDLSFDAEPKTTKSDWNSFKVCISIYFEFKRRLLLLPPHSFPFWQNAASLKQP